MIRVFIAISLASAVIEEIAKVQLALREARGDVRWARVEGMHLTLKFLGDISPHQVEPILTALHTAVQDRSPLHVRAQGLGAFPNLKRPRVLWIRVSGDGLKELHEAVETVLLPLDFPPENREFAPHLTLGRVRSLHGWERVLAVVKTYEQTLCGDSEINRVILYQSELRPEGALYSPLGSVSLGQS